PGGAMAAGEATGAADGIGRQSKAATVRVDHHLAAGDLCRRDRSRVYRGPAGPVRGRDDADGHSPRQQARRGSPAMTVPDDLDALVNELNAGAPRPRPAVRDTRTSA